MIYIDDIKHPDPTGLRKLIQSLPTLGWVQGGYAYLIVYNRSCPSKTYIIKEQL